MQQSLYERIGGRAGLARLLKHFYADVRQHAVLAPVFNREIGDWPSHLETVAAFWARLTGGPSQYSGQMPAKHFKLGIGASHFQAWLQLWRDNCTVYLGETEAREMIAMAQEIGRRLKGMVDMYRKTI
ncbi:MAG: truncated hemoglobin [Limisphaerales bacterium]